jgi:hypothetical protein
VRRAVRDDDGKVRMVRYGVSPLPARAGKSHLHHPHPKVLWRRSRDGLEGGLQKALDAHLAVLRGSPASSAGSLLSMREIGDLHMRLPRPRRGEEATQPTRPNAMALPRKGEGRP